MKPQNNLSLALTYAVPTAAALIGLLWLLRRTRDNYDDEDDTPADSKKPSLGETKTSGSLTTRDRQSDSKLSSGTGGGDGAAGKDGTLKLQQHALKMQDCHDGMTNSVHISTTSVSVESSSCVEVDRTTVSAVSPAKAALDPISPPGKASSVSSPKIPTTSDSGSSKNSASVSPATLPAASTDSSSSVVSTSTLSPRLTAATNKPTGSDTKGDSVSTCEVLTASSSSTEFISSTKADAVKPTVTLTSTASGSRKDPVQVLVRQSEEKLKQDDAAIVQAKLSASTLQSSSNGSSKPGAATFASSIEITLSNASGKPAAREVIQESFAQVAHAHVSASPQECLHPAAGQTEGNQSSLDDTDEKKLTQNAEPGSVGSCTSKYSNGADCSISGADCSISGQGSHTNSSSAGADTNCNASVSVSMSEGDKSKSEMSSDAVGSETKQSTDTDSKSDASNNTNSSASRLSTVNESESKIRSGASSSTAAQTTVREHKLDTSSDDSVSTSPRQPGGGDAKSGVTSRKSESEEKTSKNLTKAKGDAISQKKTKETSKPTKAPAVGNSVKAKVSGANKESTSLEETKRSSGSVAVKDTKSNQDSSQAKDKSFNKKGPASASSSGTSASHSAGAKVSPHAHSGKVTKSDKQAETPSKASEQHKTQAPSNSYSSKRRTKSGSSTDDRTSQEKHDSMNSVTENGRMPDSGSPICDTNSEASNDSGRGGSVGETLVSMSAGEPVCYEFNFPSELCGRLIGRGGKNIQQIKDQSGAAVLLTSNPFTPDFQICRVQGHQSEVDQALMLIRKKFPLSQHPHLDMASLAPPPSPVVLPEIMQLNIPEGVSIDIVVSAIVNAGHIFVQQPTHPTFPSLERLNHFMNACYSDLNVPTLPRPIEGGIICAAESDGQWYRAQIMQVYPAQDECDIKYVDYGGYTRVSTNTLKQIRSDFMTLPFQAVECYLANITPLQEEEFFSDKANEVLGELTSGKMLQGQVIGRGDDSVCYVHLYQVSGHSVLMINREMVNREVVRWIEIL